ncbi:MAG: hypothetical protein M0R03_17660, partial [Novosphingobium sp.]|nr:hypothetical protein [Novosphingobium sp.]
MALAMFRKSSGIAALAAGLAMVAMPIAASAQQQDRGQGRGQWSQRSTNQAQPQRHVNRQAAPRSSGATESSSRNSPRQNWSRGQSGQQQQANPSLRTPRATMRDDPRPSVDRSVDRRPTMTDQRQWQNRAPVQNTARNTGR